MKKKMNISVKQIVFIQIAVFFYSLSGVFNKMAALETIPSIKFLFYFGVSICILVCYAIVWQMILKRVPLSTAYSNKPVSMIWGMILGFLIFNETITINMIIGAAIILVGVYLVVTSNG